MKYKPRPLQTEWVNLKVSRGSQALKILPFLDAKVLKNISLETPDGVREVTNLDEIERILELDQVKMASYLDLSEFFVNTDVKKFFHFEKVYVRYPEISLESLVAVKEAFTTSTHMNCFSLGKYEMDNERFEEVFGKALDYAYKEGEMILYETKKWYFKIRTSKQQVLEINFILMIRRLTFKRVEIADVVENAIVRD
ncbi:hypothetical protein CAEBREN_04836 [Caenorhabditis brenneri]|uniref:DUF38 domain-containing protein n=1 Tax=Caenorhabditis brenneri TaxID=135651 RepID=G0N1H5_CAEBE|nr:hypothetical protein CAEBREN_04836 [Caenorhabditis brenneri]